MEHNAVLLRPSCRESYVAEQRGLLRSSASVVEFGRRCCADGKSWSLIGSALSKHDERSTAGSATVTVCARSPANWRVPA